jgi:hypothetical protein
MALSFPASPTVGHTSSQNGRQYTWDGYAWNLSSSVAGHASTHAAGGSDQVALNASQVASGTLSQSRLDFVPVHPFLLMGG